MHLCIMNQDVLKLFGEHLRKIRTKKGFTQVELAYKGNFDRNYIGMLERGERNPSLRNIIRLAEALDISLIELVSFKFK